MAKENNEKPKTNNKTKTYLLILFVGVALTIWAVFFKDKSSSDIAEDELLENEEQTQEENGTVADKDQNVGSIISGAVGSYLEGRLENSDNPSRGNLKLVSVMGQIYIKTSRSFNALIGQNVLMYIDGTLENFTLVNIEKRVEKDGFIQSQ